MFYWIEKNSLFYVAHYRVPNIPANGWWHEWTFNYDVKVDNNEVHLDIAEHEAKILVWLGDNWQPPAPEPAVESPPASEPVGESPPASEPVGESPPASEPVGESPPAVESPPADESKDASKEQKKEQEQQPDSSTNQNPESTQGEVPPQ